VDNGRASLLRERMANVTSALERLDLGLAESDVVLRLGEHFQRLEADRATLRLEVGRVQDECDWLRDELAETQVLFAFISRSMSLTEIARMFTVATSRGVRRVGGAERGVAREEVRGRAEGGHGRKRRAPRNAKQVRQGERLRAGRTSSHRCLPPRNITRQSEGLLKDK